MEASEKLHWPFRWGIISFWFCLSRLRASALPEPFRRNVRPYHRGFVSEASGHRFSIMHARGTGHGGPRRVYSSKRPMDPGRWRFCAGIQHHFSIILYQNTKIPQPDSKGQRIIKCWLSNKRSLSLIADLAHHDGKPGSSTGDVGWKQEWPEHRKRGVNSRRERISQRYGLWLRRSVGEKLHQCRASILRSGEIVTETTARANAAGQASDHS